jgi:WhiB family redox-sensing transcriptional regulator
LAAATLTRVTTTRDGEWQAPRPLVEEWEWQYRGSCRRLPPEVFFPEDSGRTGLRAREERAKQICLDCPVLNRCREHALSVRETYGVWGAMSARDRARALAPRSN